MEIMGYEEKILDSIVEGIFTRNSGLISLTNLQN